MDSIRFEPKVSAIIAVDRNLSGGSGGDLFADMLGEQLKKRTEADRSDLGVRRRPNGDRRIGSENHPAPGRRPHPAVKHAHEFNDTATTARDVTPNRDTQPTLPPPAQEHSARAEKDPASEDGAMNVGTETADDKDLQTDAGESMTVSVEGTAEPVIEDVANEQVVAVPAIAIDPAAQDQAPTAEAPVDDALVASQAPETAEPEGAPSVTPTEHDGAPEEGQAQAAFAASVAAAVGESVANLIEGTASMPEADAEILTTTNLTTMAIAKAPRAATSDAALATGAQELAAKITPEAPRPAAEAKVRPTSRTAAASEIKAQLAANQTTQTPAAPQALQMAAPVAAFSPASAGAFDPAMLGEGATAPGWALHLAQGAAAKRPDFVAQLRQHLQELPAHEQVAVNIRRAVRDGADRLTIQLSPSELGRIHVKLEMDEEKRATASITVEKPSTLELLQRDVKALERALQDAGLKMDGNDLSFSLARQDGEGFAQDLNQAGTDGHGGGTGEAEPEADTTAAVAAQVDTATGLVNVQV